MRGRKTDMKQIAGYSVVLSVCWVIYRVSYFVIIDLLLYKTLGHFWDMVQLLLQLSK